MLLAFLLSAYAGPATAYQRSVPVPDANAVAVVRAMRGSVSCSMNLMLDDQGVLLSSWGIDCPEALVPSVKSALREWGFTPATQRSVAVASELTVNFRFQARVVQLPQDPDDPVVFVPVEPLAIPRWLTPPSETRWAERILAGHDGDTVPCTLEFAVDVWGRPADAEGIDCDPALASRLLRYGRRVGFDLEGAEPGDDTRYRMEMVFRRTPPEESAVAGGER